jgi:hypothetical protein
MDFMIKLRRRQQVRWLDSEEDGDGVDLGEVEV